MTGDVLIVVDDQRLRDLQEAAYRDGFNGARRSRR
jgi:hypothetical protein